MFSFHLKELYFRFLYFNLSIWLSFFILYYNKINILFILAPIDLFYNNIIEIYWLFFLNNLFFSMLFNIPFFIYNLIFYLKTGLFKNEYYYIKNFTMFTLTLIIIFCVYYLTYFLIYLIIFSSFFNNEQLNMQISLNSYFYQISNIIYIFLFSMIIVILYQYKKITRKYIYFSLLLILIFITTLDFFTFIIIYLNCCFLIELSLILYYFFKGL